MCASRKDATIAVNTYACSEERSSSLVTWTPLGQRLTRVSMQDRRLRPAWVRVVKEPGFMDTANCKNKSERWLARKKITFHAVVKTVSRFFGEPFNLNSVAACRPLQYYNSFTIHWKAGRDWLDARHTWNPNKISEGIRNWGAKRIHFVAQDIITHLRGASVLKKC